VTLDYREYVQANLDGVHKSGMELYLAKYRDGESKVSIPLDPDFSRMLVKEAAGES